jgi:hypothetical protein
MEQKLAPGRKVEAVYRPRGPVPRGTEQYVGRVWNFEVLGRVQYGAQRGRWTMFPVDWVCSPVGWVYDTDLEVKCENMS